MRKGVLLPQVLIFLLALLITLLAVATIALGAGKGAPTAEAVIDQYGDDLLELEEVWGVGQGVDGIIVYTSEPVNLPESLEGYRLIQKVQAPVWALDRLRPNPEGGFRGTYRPRVPAGSSVSALSQATGTGTLTGWFWEKTLKRFVAVSNNHVFCDLNRLPLDFPIIQPGWLDSAGQDRSKLVIAKLLNCPELPRSEDNLFDAASALPVGSFASPSVHAPEGTFHRPSRVEKARPGLRVCKSGRSSGYYCGRIEAVSVEVEVRYGAYDVRSFVDQIITEHIGDPGDSGSLVFTADRTALVAQLFAGNDESNVVTPIAYVFDGLNVLPGCPARERFMIPSVGLQGSENSHRVFLASILLDSEFRITEQCFGSLETIYPGVVTEGTKK